MRRLRSHSDWGKEEIPYPSESYRYFLPPEGMPVLNSTMSPSCMM